MSAPKLLNNKYARNVFRVIAYFSRSRKFRYIVLGKFIWRWGACPKYNIIWNVACFRAIKCKHCSSCAHVFEHLAIQPRAELEVILLLFLGAVHPCHYPFELIRACNWIRPGLPPTTCGKMGLCVADTIIYTGAVRRNLKL